MQVNLDIKGIDKLDERLKMVERKAPDRILDRLEKESKQVRKLAKQNSPDGNDPEKKKSKKIKNSWKKAKTTKLAGTYSTGIRNSAPHYHLMERPHNYVVGLLHNRRIVGRHPGLFFFEKTMRTMEPEIKSDREKWLDELYEELSNR